MKRMHLDDKRWLARHAASKFAHKLSRKGRVYSAYRHITVDHNLAARKRRYLDVEVPKNLCLKKNYDESVAFLRKFREDSLRSNIPVRLRLENCERITPPAMLLLLAEVNRGRILRGTNAITGTYPNNQALLRRMCYTGFFELLQIRSPIDSQKTFPMEYIKFRSGVRLEAKSARELREGLLGDAIKMHLKSKNQLQRGVTEAMQNAYQHAYPDGDEKLLPVQDRWWLTGHYHRPTGNLSILFCDLGVGIPSTLPRKHPMEFIRQIASVLPGVRPDDGAMIYAGMRVGRTSTHKSNRGKGLNDLRQFIDQAQQGELTIYSRAGEYSYTSATSETYKTNNNAIAGTLIVWTVPIKSVTDWTDEEDDDNNED